MACRSWTAISPLYWTSAPAVILREIPRFNEDFLLAIGLAAGPGARTTSGLGPRTRRRRDGSSLFTGRTQGVFLTQLRNPSGRRAPMRRSVGSVEDSFAKSILYGFTVAAESPGRVLVDATDFFVRDGDGRRRFAAPRSPIASTARAARSTWSAPKPFRKTPKWK